MRILFKLTSRERPKKFLTTLKSIVDNLTPGSDHLLIITLDSDDSTLPEYIEGFKALDEEKKLPEAIIRQSGSDSKVFAINRDMPDNMEWDILVNVSDDQIFTKSGFDQDIVKGFVEAHRGSIFASNIEPKGLKFTINIPVETSYINNLKNE